MKRTLFSQKKTHKAFAATQTGKEENYPFSFYRNNASFIKSQFPIYKGLKDSVPVLDAAITKLVRLTGGFEIKCADARFQGILNDFYRKVNVGGTGQGIDRFISVFFSQLLTYGTAVGEIVVDANGKVNSLYNTPLENIELRKNPDNSTNVQICRFDGFEAVPVKHQDFTLLSTLNPEPDCIYGSSLLSSLPFLTEILMKIYASIGQNFERAGNIRYAVTYKPQSDILDRTYAKDRAQQIASEWSSAMQKGTVKDFVAVGDVDIKVIGADNQVLDSEVPVRQMLEQIIAKTGLPPFMLGLSWSSTERMSAQQADVLTSELWAYRRILTPVIEKICDTFLHLNGISTALTVVWDDITLQDETEEARARLYNAQAAKIEKEGEKN